MEYVSHNSQIDYESSKQYTIWQLSSYIIFFFNDTATTEIYTLSLHDALPISGSPTPSGQQANHKTQQGRDVQQRSEEHTSELQSHSDLVCRLLLEKKKHLSSSYQIGIAHI